MDGYLSKRDVEVLREVLELYDDIQWFENEKWEFEAKNDKGKYITLHIATEEYYLTDVEDEFSHIVHHEFTTSKGAGYRIYEVLAPRSEVDNLAENFHLDIGSDIVTATLNHVNTITETHNVEILEGTLLDEFLIESVKIKEVIPEEVHEDFLSLREHRLFKGRLKNVDLNTTYKYAILEEEYETSQSSYYKLTFTNDDNHKLVLKFKESHDMEDEDDEFDNGVNYHEHDEDLRRMIEGKVEEDDQEEIIPHEESTEESTLEDLINDPLLKYYSLIVGPDKRDEVHPDYIYEETARNVIAKYGLEEYILAAVTLYKLKDGSIITVTRVIENTIR